MSLEILRALAQAEHDRRFNAANQAILSQRVAEYDKIEGPRVGDFLELSDGSFVRFSHDWGDKLQTSKDGSFYLGNGYCSFSGGLSPGVATADVVATDRKRAGSCWFFENDYPGAGRGLNVTAEFRVFTLRDGADTSGIDIF